MDVHVWSDYPEVNVFVDYIYDVEDAMVRGDEKPNRPQKLWVPSNEDIEGEEIGTDSGFSGSGSSSSKSREKSDDEVSDEQLTVCMKK